ncbi:MAG: hypothetical protein JW801_10795, partial [Bacteroidales bacterium]|nr:hypothetical protein [Bacteroidales bacterium]
MLRNIHRWSIHVCARPYTEFVVKYNPASRDSDQKIRAMLTDNELLQQFKAVEQMDEDDKST